HAHQPVGTNAGVTIARRARRRRVDRPVAVAVEQHEEVVAEAVVLRQLHRDQSPRRAGTIATGFRSAPYQWMRGSRRNQTRWRLAKARVRRTISSLAASSGAPWWRWSRTSL